MKCFSDDSFSLFQEQVLLIFHLLFWFHVKFKQGIQRHSKIFWTVHAKLFIRYQGKNLDLFWIWCCFQFFLHCLVQPNQVIQFLFYIFYHKNQTMNLWNSQLVLEISFFKVFINVCKLAGEMPVDWSFFPWCLTFSEFIVNVCNRLNFILITNTMSLSLTKI